MFVFIQYISTQILTKYDIYSQDIEKNWTMNETLNFFEIVTLKSYTF